MRTAHWILVACIATAWLTRESMLIDLHATAGYGALLIVTFRIAWGFVGPKHARFASFAYSPSQALGYLRELVRGTPRHYAGHNPAGSWSVYALLAGVAVTALLGLAAAGAMFSMGPLAGILGAAAGDRVRELHEWLAWALLWLIVAHVVGAIASSLAHRENLVAAMFTGRKLPHGDESGDAPARAFVAMGLFGALSVFVLAYLDSTGWLEGYRDLLAAPKPPASIPATWKRECSDCHLAYAPALLPVRSWERMLAEQATHFGEDLSLSEAKLRQLAADAAAAQSPPGWAAWKLNRSVAPGHSPQRFSEIRFWRHAHRDLPEASFRPPVSAGKHDCEACHRDAASGIFHPRMIQKPVRGSIL